MTAQPPSPEPDGTVVIGPQCFASADRLIISWHGVNYYQLTKLEPLTVKPADDVKPAPEPAATVLAEVLDFLDGGIPPGDEFAGQVAQWRKRGLAETPEQAWERRTQAAGTAPELDAERPS